MSRRSSNFTLKEKNLLLDLIKNFKSVIDNKSSGAASLDEKNQAWDIITEEYNCASQCDLPRDTRQLKLLYKNLKRKTRNVVAEENLKQKDHYVRVVVVKEEHDDGIRATEGDCYNPVYEPLENNHDDAVEYFVQNLSPDLHLKRPKPENVASRIETPEPPEPIPTTSNPKLTPKQKKFRINYKNLYLKKKYEVACFELKSKKELHKLDVEIKKQQLKQFNQ